MKAIGIDHLRDLRERSIAARSGMLSDKGWQKFMDALEREEAKEMKSTARNLDEIIGEPRSNYDEGEIEWLK